MRLAVLLVVILLFALSPHSEGKELTMASNCLLDAIHIVPSLNLTVSSRADAQRLYDPQNLGYALIDSNAWGLEQFRGEFTGSTYILVDNKGYLRFGAELDLTNISLKPWNVIAYPEIIYGVKPWIPELRPYASPHLSLPMRLADLPRILVLVDYAVSESTVPYNVAFDMWILKGSTPRTPREGDVEVMIWLHKYSSNFSLQPAGRKIGFIELDVVVDGFPQTEKFEVWYHDRIGDGWRYIAFVIENSKPYREIGLDLTRFIEKTAEFLGLSRTDYYVFSLEFGFEIFYGPRVKFNAAIYRYSMLIGREAGLSALLNYSPRATPLVAWIVPWGYLVETEKIPPFFNPGVVVAYDVECGLCTSYLQVWFRRSLSYIEEFAKEGRVVFVNIFPEIYHPSWKWRGQLAEFKLNETVIEKLRELLGDGENTYIGFSELTACVNNPECRELVIKAYKKLRELFTAARLYYYGSGGDDPEAIRDLYMRGGLDLVGIDVWNYEYTSGRVRLANHIVEKIAYLSRTTHAGGLIIGEIGFRTNDKEAFIEPWNKHRPIVYEKGVHVAYYLQSIEHLLSIARPKTIGFWSWNDEVFSIMRDSELHASIQEVLLNKGIISRRLCEEPVQTTDRTWEYSEWTDETTKYTLVVMIGAVLPALFFMVKKVLRRK